MALTDESDGSRHGHRLAVAAIASLDGANGTRTRDLLAASQTLSQLSYGPAAENDSGALRFLDSWHGYSKVRNLGGEMPVGSTRGQGGAPAAPVQAGLEERGEFRCAACGYGVVAAALSLPECPMCRESDWEPATGRTFTGAAAADPDADEPDRLGL